jgi:hypothetical protein
LIEAQINRQLQLTIERFGEAKVFEEERNTSGEKRWKYRLKSAV